MVSSYCSSPHINMRFVVADRVLGWDACFEYEGQTYAEMRGEEKNEISHRGKALEKLKEWLKQEAA